MIIIFSAFMLLLLLGLIAQYLYNSGAFTKTAPKFWYRQGRNHDDKNRSRGIAQNVEGASRYPHVSPSLPLRGTDQPQAFNEALPLYGLWRERGQAFHAVYGKTGRVSSHL